MSSSDWIPIQYRDFYDIPRIFVMHHHGDTFVFDCPFDDDADEYREHYVVRRLDGYASAAVAQASWKGLSGLGSFVGQVATRLVRFDPTRRAAVDATILQHLKPSADQA